MQIKEARIKIEELEDKDLTDLDNEDGNQFLMFGEHIFPDLDFKDLEESNSGNEDDDPGPFMLNANIWCGMQQVNYYPLQHYNAMGITPPMWQVWLDKDPLEPVYEEATTEKALWYNYTHYLGHKNSIRESITSTVHGPFDATGMTLAEARIAAEAQCAKYESHIAGKLLEFRCCEKAHSPEEKTRQEIIKVYGPPAFMGHYPSRRTLQEEHPEFLIHTLPVWPSWPDYDFAPDTPRDVWSLNRQAPDLDDSDDDSAEPPPLLLNGMQPSGEDSSSSSSKDESEDEAEDKAAEEPHVEFKFDFTEVGNQQEIEMFDFSKCYIGQTEASSGASHESGFAFAQANVHANVHPLFTTGVVMNQSSSSSPDLKLGWLLDNQSTDDIECNRDPVVPGSIVKSDHKMRIHTNAGVLVVTQKCRVAGYPQEIWFSAKGKDNVLSFKHVLAVGLQISYDCSVPSFTVHR